jgi:hypothetical protein
MGNARSRERRRNQVRAHRVQDAAAAAAATQPPPPAVRRDTFLSKSSSVIDPHAEALANPPPAILIDNEARPPLPRSSTSGNYLQPAPLADALVRPSTAQSHSRQVDFLPRYPTAHLKEAAPTAPRTIMLYTV